MIKELDSKYERLAQNLLQEIQELKAICGHSVRNTEQPLECPISATNLVEPPNSVLTATAPNKQHQKKPIPENDRTGVSNFKQVGTSMTNEAEEQAGTREHTPSPQDGQPQCLKQQRRTTSK